MDAQTFVSLWKAEKDSMLVEFRQGDGMTAQLFRALQLDSSQSEILWKAVDAALSDVFYTLLLGLDGASAIGGEQHSYELRAEDGKVISDCGEIEAEAFEQLR
jgi:hypothetical protein